MSTKITEQQKKLNDFKTELTELSFKYNLKIEPYGGEIIVVTEEGVTIDDALYFDKDLQKYV